MPYKDPEKRKEYKRLYYRRKKYGEDNRLKPPVYPEIKIPENMRETQYPGYYITEDGKAYRAPGKLDRNGQYGKINEYGLIYLNPGYRGHPGRPEHQYECINISVRDENGKFLKQITKSIHQLVAQAFVDNPEGYTEIMHLDANNRNNHYTNLKWGTHEENMKMTAAPEGTITEHKRSSIGNRNPSRYIKKDGEWVLIPSTKPPWNKGLKGVSWNTLPDGTVTTRKVNGKPGTFIKQNGEWVYQTNNPKPRGKSSKENKPKRKQLPDGTIRTRADGTVWKKQNGEWVYQKKRKHI